MAERDHRQPMLLGLVDAPKREARVEYDKAAQRAAARADESEAPWWNRVRKVREQAADKPLPTAPGWRAMLEATGWVAPLPPGERIVLERRVTGLEHRPGVVEAGVRPQEGRPHRVQLRVQVLSEADWARIVRALPDEGPVRAALEAGRLPASLTVAAACGDHALVPAARDIVASCTCGRPRLPCDHVVAVHLAFCRLLEREPQSLLVLRGARAADLLALLERVRAQAVETAEARTEPDDPFTAPSVPAPDWALLQRPPPPRPPLPSPDGWRGASLDALVRRLLARGRT